MLHVGFFAVVGPTVWNILPDDLIDSGRSCKSFRCSFNKISFFVLLAHKHISGFLDDELYKFRIDIGITTE